MGPRKIIMKIIQKCKTKQLEQIDNFYVTSDGSFALHPSNSPTNKMQSIRTFTNLTFQNESEKSYDVQQKHNYNNILEESNNIDNDFTICNLDDSNKSNSTSTISECYIASQSFGNTNAITASQSFGNTCIVGNTDCINNASSSTAIHLPNKECMTVSNIEQVSKHQFSRYLTVENTLFHHPNGKELLNVIKDTEYAFGETDRRSLVRIVINELKTLHNTLYPLEEAKIALAIAIVTEFPRLKANGKDNEKQNKSGYKHYYSPLTKRGFLEFRLWTIRKSATPTKKKYNISRVSNNSQKETSKCKLNFDIVSTQLLSEQLLEEKISSMKFKFPTNSNKNAIASYLSDTYFNRRNWILHDNPTIIEIFERYPRLLDYKGEMNV